MRQRCPKPEVLLEYISIPKDISFWQRRQVKSHAKQCDACRQQISGLQAKWESFLAPELDVTSSLLRVYSRLQNDETLILKGWKLGASRPVQPSHFWLTQGWLFRGAVSIGLGGLLAFFAVDRLGGQDAHNDNGALVQETATMGSVPMAQIRIKEKDRIKVHYVEPELLQSVEFETTGTGR